MSHRIISAGVVLFFLYHALAVLLVSIPREAPWASTVQRMMPRLRAHIYTTSQWQEWNLFSPNPLRRVTQYRIERKDHGAWIPVKTICAQTLPECRRADELKLLSRITDDAALAPVRERYVEDVCRSQRLAPGTRVRLVLEEYDLPRGPLSPAEWRAFAPTAHARPDVETVCPG